MELRHSTKGHYNSVFQFQFIGCGIKYSMHDNVFYRSFENFVKRNLSHKTLKVERKNTL